MKEEEKLGKHKRQQIDFEVTSFQGLGIWVFKKRMGISTTALAKLALDEYLFNHLTEAEMKQVKSLDHKVRMKGIIDGRC